VIIDNSAFLVFSSQKVITIFSISTVYTYVKPNITNLAVIPHCKLITLISHLAKYSVQEDKPAV
jgi:hypothetical protein